MPFARSPPSGMAVAQWPSPIRTLDFDPVVWSDHSWFVAPEHCQANTLVPGLVDCPMTSRHWPLLGDVADICATLVVSGGASGGAGLRGHFCQAAVKRTAGRGNTAFELAGDRGWWFYQHTSLKLKGRKVD